MPKGHRVHLVLLEALGNLAYKVQEEMLVPKVTLVARDKQDHLDQEAI